MPLWYRLASEPNETPRQQKRREYYRARWYEKNKLHCNAHQAVMRAVKAGRLIRPATCSECGVSCKPLGHHTDYDRPLDVVWLCAKCHGKTKYGAS